MSADRAIASHSWAVACWEKAELREALTGCDRILNDEFSDYPEKSLYAIGIVDEAKKL
ncbi:hypothetical protein [Hydrococcus rivularis]|uniref:hypothetical protein n=1 Tax=Hydrococcus rivularis TaxID=1616834 RepID=UPI000AA7002F|nr:hypothetical protein [Hydrococcus rivularis]